MFLRILSVIFYYIHTSYFTRGAACEVVEDSRIRLYILTVNV
jgi:hypothetical protein